MESLKKALAPALLLLLLPPLVSSPARAAGEGGQELNRIVLRVNDEIFTLFDYELKKARRTAAVLNDPSISPAQRQERLGGIGKEVMQEALHDMLLASQAKRSTITVNDAEVEASIADVRREQGIDSDEDFQLALSQSGLTIETLRSNFRQEMVTGRLVQKEVTAKIEVSGDEMRAYYRNNPDEFRTPEERRLREVIVLEASGLPDGELKKMAAKLHQELSAPGAKGAEIVGRYQDQGYSSSLIDLGWLKKGELEKSLSEAAWALEVGSYAAPIRARGGYHVVLLEEKRGGEVQAYADVENRIMMRERQKRFGKEYRTYLAQLEKGSYIQENPPAESLGYRSLSGVVAEDDELNAFRAPLPQEQATAGTKVEDAKPASESAAAAQAGEAAAQGLAATPVTEPVDLTPRDVTPTDGVPTGDTPLAPLPPAPPPEEGGSGGSGGGGGGAR